MVVIAHAVAYLTHEYSHSFMRWTLGWMTDPMALDYGQPTLYNLLFLEMWRQRAVRPDICRQSRAVCDVIALSGTLSVRRRAIARGDRRELIHGRRFCIHVVEVDSSGCRFPASELSLGQGTGIRVSNG